MSHIINFIQLSVEINILLIQPNIIAFFMQKMHYDVPWNDFHCAECYVHENEWLTDRVSYTLSHTEIWNKCAFFGKYVRTPRIHVRGKVRHVFALLVNVTR